MALEGGQDKGGQLVWKRDDDSIVPVRIMIDSGGNLVPVPSGPGATEAKQDDILAENRAVRGSSGDGTVQLTAANTWKAIPPSPPAEDYLLFVTKENEAGIIRFSSDNGGVPSVTNGNKAPKHLSMRMAANTSLYYGSSDAGDDVNFWTVENV